MGINMELGPPFAAITASTLLGRHSSRCWNIAAGICIHSAIRALERAFIPTVFDGVEVRALCRPVKFFHKYHFCTGFALCTGALSC